MKIEIKENRKFIKNFWFFIFLLLDNHNFYDILINVKGKLTKTNLFKGRSL